MFFCGRALHHFSSTSLVITANSSVRPNFAGCHNKFVKYLNKSIRCHIKIVPTTPNKIYKSSNEVTNRQNQYIRSQIKIVNCKTKFGFYKTKLPHGSIRWGRRFSTILNEIELMYLYMLKNRFSSSIPHSVP